MSVFLEGQKYDLLGEAVWCVRRWFSGPLEMVELSFEAAAGVEAVSFVRTARTMGALMRPQITETLGGVTLPALCDHHRYGMLVASAGPHEGLRCCDACGTPPALSLDHDSNQSS